MTQPAQTITYYVSCTVDSDGAAETAQGVLRAIVRGLPPEARDVTAMTAEGHTAQAYRAAADDIDGSEELRDYTDDHMSDMNEAAEFLRRRATAIETGADQ